MTADIVRINRRGLAPVAGKRRRATNKQIMAEVRSGFMHKCGKGVKSWKRRWFVLKPNGYLYYFESQSSHTEKGKVDIVDATKVAPWSEVSTAEKKLPSGYSTANTFAIVSGDRTYTCICENDGEHLEWISAIERVRGGNGEQEYPPATYAKNEPAIEKAVKTVASAPPAVAPVAPPPYTPSPTTPPAAQPRAAPQPVGGPPMPNPTQYGGSLPRAGPYQQPPPPPPAAAAAGPQQYGNSLPRAGSYQQPAPLRAPPQQQRSAPFAAPMPAGGPGYQPMPAGGPGYQQAYPVGNYRPPPPQPQAYPPRGYAHPPPRPGPAPYQQAPPPYYKPTGPPRAPYQPRPPQPGYYQGRPPQQPYYPRPPPPMQQQQQTTVTIVRL